MSRFSLNLRLPTNLYRIGMPREARGADALRRSQYVGIATIYIASDRAIL